jgi:PilZ domain
VVSGQWTPSLSPTSRFAKAANLTYAWLTDIAVLLEENMPEKAIPLEAEFTLLKREMRAAKVRGAARYRCPLATLGRLLFPQTGERADAWISNLSRTGIGLSLDRPLEPDTSLIIQLKSSTTTLRLEARVIHATPQADATWRIGCELLEQLTPDMLDELL